MPGDLDYSSEKFSSAVDILVTAEGALRDRLYSAYVNQAIHGSPTGGGAGPPMSEELGRRINSLREKLTALPATGQEGTLLATIQLLDDDDVAEAAREVVRIDRAISRELWQLGRSDF